jgi:hypothetical protein
MHPQENISLHNLIDNLIYGEKKRYKPLKIELKTDDRARLFCKTILLNLTPGRMLYAIALLERCQYDSGESDVGLEDEVSFQTLRNVMEIITPPPCMDILEGGMLKGWDNLGSKTRKKIKIPQS